MPVLPTSSGWCSRSKANSSVPRPGSWHGQRWQVLYDFNKLLCARADLARDGVAKDKIEEGVGLLESRLQDAAGWDEGYWLLSGWGRDGFEHVEYHNGQRQN